MNSHFGLSNKKSSLNLKIYPSFKFFTITFGINFFFFFSFNLKKKIGIPTLWKVKYKMHKINSIETY